MLFQTLDNKSQCVGVYTDNKLVFDLDKLPQGLSQTWSYAPYLKGKDIEYVSLYLEGETLQTHLPEFLLDDWEDITRSLSAFKRAHTISKVNMDENCFYDLVPTRFLIEWCKTKNNITQHIASSLPKPKRYEFYKHVHIMLRDIEDQKINYNKKMVSSYLGDKKLSAHANNILKSRGVISYNQFGTKTGRLTTKPKSFPILTLPRAFRKAIIPNNDFFVELDFNGAEIRTLLGLLERQQPLDDIHEYHLESVFNDMSHRDQAKQAFFAWLYGSKKYTSSTQGTKLDSFYDKQKLLQKYYQDQTVITPYHKKIKNTSSHHALNYLIQSTTAELVLKQALKINHYLRKRQSKSFLACVIHDAVVLDMKHADLHELLNIKKLMESTNFGKFKINIKKGKSLGELKSG